MLRTLTIVLLLWLPTAKGHSWQTFQQWLSQTHHFTATFTQSVLQENNEPLATIQQGKIWLSTPFFLRWEIDKPSKNLVLVDAQQGFSWHYDPDLQQAIRQPFNTLSGVSPAEILLADKNDPDLRKLRANFDLSEENTLDGKWLVATPKVLEKQDLSSATFRWFKLKISSNGLETIRVRDALDRTVDIHFSQPQYPEKLDDGLFQFVPTQSTDVIDHMSSDEQ